MKTQKALFVINPKSGNSDKSRLEEQIKHICAKNSKDYAVFYTTGENDKEKINKKQSDYRADTIVACGGDGTVNLVAQIAINTDIQLGIIPLGSANGLAYELEISEDIESSLDLIFRGETFSMDVIEINDEFVCLHLSDLGFNAKMIREFEVNGERGMLAYAKSFFSSLLDKKANVFSIYFDGKGKEVEAEMIVFANASSYGSGAVINPGSQLDDGSFEVVIFKPMPLNDLLSLTLESFLGDIKNSPYVEIHQVQEVKISCKETELLQVDGELKGDKKTVSAKILKGALKVIR